MSTDIRERIESMKERQLLFINPKGPASSEPTHDELSKAFGDLFWRKAVPNNDHTRGVHTCVCGERSKNFTYTMPDGRNTNSLAVHYLVWHRNEVPEEEVRKARELLEQPGGVLKPRAE